MIFFFPFLSQLGSVSTSLKDIFDYTKKDPPSSCCTGLLSVNPVDSDSDSPPPVPAYARVFSHPSSHTPNSVQKQEWREEKLPPPAPWDARGRERVWKIDKKWERQENEEPLRICGWSHQSLFPCLPSFPSSLAPGIGAVSLRCPWVQRCLWFLEGETPLSVGVRRLSVVVQAWHSLQGGSFWAKQRLCHAVKRLAWLGREFLKVLRVQNLDKA